MTTPPTDYDAKDDSLDNDGWTKEQVQERFKDKHPDMTELELRVLMNIHSKNSCATGIWCESELSDWVDLIQQLLAEAQQQARIDEVLRTPIDIMITPAMKQQRVQTIQSGLRATAQEEKR